jgi:hypothetical protein
LAERISTPANFQIHGFCRFNRNTLFFQCFYDRGCSAKMDIGPKFPLASLNEATTSPSITKQRMSLPFASLMNFD